VTSGKRDQDHRPSLASVLECLTSRTNGKFLGSAGKGIAMFTIRRIGAVAAIAGAATVAFASSASADPQKGGPLTLNCADPVGTVEAVVFSNGRWSPALDSNSNAVLHPVAFSDQFFEVRDADSGDLIFKEEPPSVAKNAPANKQVVACTYVQEFLGVDPETGEPVIIKFGGTVEGWTPANG
jgi:hypothetical protein